MRLRILGIMFLPSLVIAGTLGGFCALLLANGETGSKDRRTPKGAVPVTVTVVNSPVLPRDFALQQNYPNPFNPSTTIGYSIPTVTKVTLEVFDVLGRKVATLVDAVKPAGFHSCCWEADNMPSGVYFYRIRAGAFTKTLKMIQLK